MTDGRFWLCIEGMATTLDGNRNREAEERQLDELERDLRGMRQLERDEMRRRMILIVAQLSRLEVRLIETDGPVRDPRYVKARGN